MAGRELYSMGDHAVNVALAEIPELAELEREASRSVLGV